MNNSPIGVFDSGYGGLTVLRELVKQLPEYDYCYLGDNARAPYGTRDFDTVYQYTLQAVKWFFEQGCPLVILACNTASAKALRSIQQRDLPLLAPDKRVLGVIRPTAEVIGQHSATGHVGVLGTPGTVQSASYLLEIAKFFPHLAVSQEACPMWVPLVENQEQEAEGADYFVKKHINAIYGYDNQIDTLLLACTHYPLLLKKIAQYTRPGTKLVTQGAIVAQSLDNYLQRHPALSAICSKNGRRDFFSTGDTHSFGQQASAFFGEAVEARKLIWP
jgi:glutamate racemase